MFDTLRVVEAVREALGAVAARGRPVAMAGGRLLEVPAALAGLFPDGAMRRGSTLAVDPAPGGWALALALASGVTRHGWVAAIGSPALGLVAAAEMGVRLDRLALVPDPGGQWPVVVAAVVDGFDLILVRPTGRVRSGDARRLMARVRERGAVMAVLEPAAWPEPFDIRLAVTSEVWEGLGDGHGLLRRRRVEVTATGRRAAGRESRAGLWLPSGGGGVEPDQQTTAGAGRGMSRVRHLATVREAAG